MAPRKRPADKAAPKKLATPRQVRDQARDMEQEYLRCKSYGHQFDPFTVERLRGAFIVHLKCHRCTTVTSQEISLRGMLLTGRSYNYPDGYLFKGIGRIQGEARGAIRAACITNDLKMFREIESHGDV